MVSVDSDRVSRAPRYSGIRFGVQFVFVYVDITRYGSPFQRASTNDWFGNSTVADPTTPNPPEGAIGLEGCSEFALATTIGINCCFLFLQVLRWFTSLGSLVPDYVFIGTLYGFTV